MKQGLLFFDTEIHGETGKVLDIGAIRSSGVRLHTKNQADFAKFIRGSRFFCGHNILAHDLKYVGKLIQDACPGYIPIDTLCLSPLLFPTKPYHKLLKNDKLQVDELNNPLNDAIKAAELFFDELNAFANLPPALQNVYCALLAKMPEFAGFFAYMDRQPGGDVVEDIRRAWAGRICANADLALLVRKTPVELAYTLALIHADDRHSITPPWVMRHYPRMDNVMKLLRATPCAQGCPYCKQRLNVRTRLKEYFGYDGFRTYDGEPLQEQAAQAAVDGKSLLAVFPTGGGKSITFQLPALMAGETSRGLTVVISPLQSLMKDQVDNLEQRGIVDAVTINGLLDPIERKAAIDRVANGTASILYISPESLRSATIENLLLSRNVVRFVIDEAHCFSAWGQDFRVDYLYIGDFIRMLQKQKNLNHDIPVSCFTATAKQKVISDIREYFRQKLGLELALFTTRATRRNLHYAVLFKENDAEKYAEMRNLIQAKNCPTIVYVSRVKHTYDLARRLQADGFSAQPYNGKMDSTEKIQIQNDFIRGDTQIIVATSAFGMGVDKKDVGLVIHYNISDSLENYVQESGRAGRDASLNADCYVLFNDEDLDKHFILLNQTKLSISEIQQVWRAVKDLARHDGVLSCSALELARQAGWDDTVSDVETRVTTAVSALENAGYLVRGRNVPHIYADSILVSNMAEAAMRIDRSRRFSPQQRNVAKQVVKYLISRRSTHATTSDTAESRVDYLADRTGIPKQDVVDAIMLMREDGILADHMDLTVHIRRNDTQNRSAMLLRRFTRLEDFLIDNLPSGERINYRELNDRAIREGIKTATVKDIKTIVFYWTLCGYLAKSHNPDDERVYLERTADVAQQRAQFQRRAALSGFIVQYLFEKSASFSQSGQDGGDKSVVGFSIMEVENAFNGSGASPAATSDEIQKALLYLSKIQALSIDGGFLVSYNSMQLRRLVMDNHIKYKQEDYKQLEQFYRQRMQQIHIVGEYAHLMVRDYEDALQFVSDYFQMDYHLFLRKYFKGTRMGEINRNITPEKYEKLIASLSDAQRGIMDDDASRHIVVAAGPGSGKTKLLVHKLASLLMLEDVKHEQLLMLTFSRAAATEFKQRLMDLIGNAAHFVDIKTFHSYSFDLMGKIGNLEDAANVVQQAAELICRGEVETERITKTVLVIDEAQDMDSSEFALVEALMRQNEDMRVIAVGDDDQNIYEFRGSDSEHLRTLITAYGATQYPLLDNFRSGKAIVEAANAFAATIRHRIKTQPIAAVRDAQGQVTIGKYVSRNLEVPLVTQLASRQDAGTRCVLTATNDEALRVMGLLTMREMPARLIQSNDEFDLTRLAELRFFLAQLGDAALSPIIDDALWRNAAARMEGAFPRSACLPLCRRILETFAAVNEKKYRSDLEAFLRESNVEDFITADRHTVLVSTIHKAKGREFDHVYLLLSGYNFASDAARRAVYVGMTRARDTLHIHTDSDFFDDLPLPAAVRYNDKTDYGEPQEILLQLSHRDVFLDYFKPRKERIMTLQSGDALFFREGALYVGEAPGYCVARLSQACQSRVAGLLRKGYRVHRAAVRFVVYWQGKEDTEETPILLPEIYFRRDDA